MNALVNTLFVTIATFGQVADFFPFGTELAVVLGAVWLYVSKRYMHSATRFWLWITCAVLTAAVVVHVAEMMLGGKDPSSIVLDEFVAVPFVFIFYTLSSFRNDILVLLLGIFLYGALDSFKPFPINLFEQLPGGVGIIADDLAAALGAAAILYLLQHLLTVYRATFKNKPLDS